MKCNNIFQFTYTILVPRTSDCPGTRTVGYQSVRGWYNIFSSHVEVGSLV